MESTKRKIKKAKTTKSQYDNDVREVKNWLETVESKVQSKNVEPQELLETLQHIQLELSKICDQCDRIQSNGAILVESTNDQGKKESVQNSIKAITDQLNQVKTWLDAKKSQAGDSLDSWQTFIQLYNSMRSWIEKQKTFLSEQLIFANLNEAKIKLREYKAADRECKWAAKQINEMNQEIVKIGEISSVAPLSEKFCEMEQEKGEVDSKLKQFISLLQEMTEEWEQCEQKCKDIVNWIEKTNESSSNSNHKKKPLRDQLTAKENTLSNVSIQKTKLSLAMEKLQVHFRDNISVDASVLQEVDELHKKLDAMHGVLKDECNTLETCVQQMDLYQKDIHKLRQNIMDMEKQLRIVSSPSYSALNLEKAQAEQNACKEKIKAFQCKIKARNERIKLLVQRGIPDTSHLNT